MKRGQVGVLVFAVAAVAIGIAIYVRKPGSKTSTSADSGSATGSSTIEGVGGSHAGDPEDDAVEDTRYRVIDADARMALMQRIVAARAAREARKAGKPAPGPTPAGPDDPPALPGELTPDQIMEGILPVMPLLKECYEQGLERRTIKNGKVTFAMHLTGEPEIGTLVDRAELDGDPAFLADAELSQCLHETMMSLELPPMSEGSELLVRMPMVFSVDGDDDGEPRDAR